MSGVKDPAVVKAQNGQTLRTSRKRKGNPWRQDGVMLGENAYRGAWQEGTLSQCEGNEEGGPVALLGEVLGCRTQPATFPAEHPTEIFLWVEEQQR